MDELEQQKLEAEVANLRALAARTEAETAKLNEERRKPPRTFGQSFVESLKVFGALIVGAGGVMTAITGYQLSEVKKEKMDLLIQQADKDLAKKTEELKISNQRKAEIDAAAMAAQRQTEETKNELAQLRETLVAVKNGGSPQANNDAIDQAIQRTEQIGRAVETTQSQLRTATARPASAGEWQVMIGDYEDQKEALGKQAAAAKAGFSNSEIYGQVPHLHMRFRFASKDEAASAAKKLKDAKVSHEPEVMPYRAD